MKFKITIGLVLIIALLAGHAAAQTTIPNSVLNVRTISYEGELSEKYIIDDGTNYLINLDGPNGCNSLKVTPFIYDQLEIGRSYRYNIMQNYIFCPAEILKIEYI